MFSAGIICFSDSAASSTITFVSSGAGAASSPNIAVSTRFSTIGSNLIVVAVGTETTTVSISDTAGNTYTLVRTDTTTSDYLMTYYCYNPVVTAANKITINSLSGYPAVCAAAFSGVATSPLDQQNGFGTTGVTAIQPGSITPSANNYLLISGVMTDYASTFPTPTIDSGFTISNYIPLSGSTVGCGLAYLIQTLALPENPKWSGFALGHCVSSIVSFK